MAELTALTTSTTNVAKEVVEEDEGYTTGVKRPWDNRKDSEVNLGQKSARRRPDCGGNS